MIYRLDDLIESQDFEHDEKFVKAIHWKEACDELEDKVKTIVWKDQRIQQLESALRDMLQVVDHLAKSDHPYTAHEHRDTLEHRFGLQIEVAAQTLERNKEILDTINNQLNDTKYRIYIS